MAQHWRNYATIGVVNTLLHWLVFALLYRLGGLTQAVSNLGGFMVAASFSFLANARYTFRCPASWRRYVRFVGFMGLLSLAVGHLADLMQLHGLVTLLLFSLLSLVVGYLYSARVVFKEPPT